MTPNEVERIVNAYGRVLREQTATGVVRDIRSLPYSKGQIKEALRFAIRITSDESMRGHFKGAYIGLSDFQELSDAQILALQTWNKVLANSSTEDKIDDLHKQAIDISSVGKEVATVQASLAAEAHALAEELKAAGF
jgi:hypothetical protein